MLSSIVTRVEADHVVISTNGTESTVSAPGELLVSQGIEPRTDLLTALRRLAPREVLPFLAKAEPDWAALFREAGLELKRFRKIEPLFAPPVFADSRSSWIGVYASRPEIRIRVDADRHVVWAA